MVQELAEAVRDLQRSIDPEALLDTIRRCQGQLAVLLSGEQGSVNGSAQTERDLAAENSSLFIFLDGLQTLLHRSQPKRRKPKLRTGKRYRPDQFQSDVKLIEQWLQAEALIRAKTLMERWIDHNPERDGKRHLRTLQWRFRDYRLYQIELEMEQALAATYLV